MKQIVLVGCFCETVELCQCCGYEIIGVVDVSDHAAAKSRIPYLGTDETFLKRTSEYGCYPLVIVPDDPQIRRRIAERYRVAGFAFETVVSPEAEVSPSATLGEGCVVQTGVRIMAEVSVGAFVRMNVGATVMHEVQIGDYSTITPRATILGRVRIGKNCYIGASSTILPSLTIGDDVVVGAGAVVTRDVLERGTVAGVPARRFEKRA